MNKRIFLAVNLPAETKKRISSELQPQAKAKGLRPVSEENLHITMAFLGYLNPEAVQGLKESLSALGKTEKFELELKGTGHFRNRVLWLGVGKGSDGLKELREKINSALGISDPKFHAHVTLARNKSLKPEEVDSILSEMEKKGFNETVAAESLDIMESVLSNQAPAYSVLARIEFG